MNEEKNMTFIGLSELKTKKREIVLTEAAANQIKSLSQRLPEAKGKYLRVYVQGGGCSGFTYNFKFDDKRVNDVLVETEEAVCLVDPQSASLLEGSTIDYTDGLTGAGFNIKNPNAKGTCGCGSSFSV